MDPITKSNHAKRLLEDEVLKEAFEQVEHDIFFEWKTTAPSEHSKRSDLFHTLEGLERLKARLRAILDDGVVSKSRN